MKKIIYISLLAFLVAVSACKKDSFATFEIEKANPVTDSLLQSKYLTPFQQAEVMELTLMPKGNEIKQVFYLFKGTGTKLNMVGKSRQYATPAEVDVKYATNTVTATVDFTESSLFSSIITDLGEELTRGADHSYAFTQVHENRFEMEGIQYGDKLSIRILNPASEEAKYIAGGGIQKDYTAQDQIYYSTPFISFDVDGKPVQMVVDPNYSGVWLFYSNAKNQDDWIENTTSYLPTASHGLSYITSSLGDTLRFNKDVPIKNVILKGLVWNAERTKYRALVQENNQEKLVDLKQQTTPFYSFTEERTFELGETLERNYYFSKATIEEKMIYDIVNRIKLPTKFKIDFDKLSSDANYSSGWSAELKSQFLAIRNKAKELNPDKNITSFEFDFAKSRDFFSTLELDIHIGLLAKYKIMMEKNGVKDSIQYTNNILAFKVDLVTFVNHEFYGFDDPVSVPMKVPENTSRAYKIWPQLYEVLKNFDNAVTHINYLPALQANQPMRIQMKSMKTNKQFVVDGIVPK